MFNKLIAPYLSFDTQTSQQHFCKSPVFDFRVTAENLDLLFKISKLCPMFFVYQDYQTKGNYNL